MFEIFPIRAFADNYMWTLVEGDQAIVVDPGEAKPIIEAFGAKNLDRVIIIKNNIPESSHSGLSSEDIAWQESRRKRKVRKLDFEIR